MRSAWTQKVTENGAHPDSRIPTHKDPGRIIYIFAYYIDVGIKVLGDFIHWISRIEKIKSKLHL